VAEALLVEEEASSTVSAAVRIGGISSGNAVRRKHLGASSGSRVEEVARGAGIAVLCYSIALLAFVGGVSIRALRGDGLAGRDGGSASDWAVAVVKVVAASASRADSSRGRQAGSTVSNTRGASTSREHVAGSAISAGSSAAASEAAREGARAKVARAAREVVAKVAGGAGASRA
jgi:hypothetical protein